MTYIYIFVFVECLVLFVYICMQNFEEHHREREASVAALKDLSAKYISMIEEEIKKKPEQLLVDRAGQIDAKMRLQNTIDSLLTDTLLQNLGSMISTLAF